MCVALALITWRRSEVRLQSHNCHKAIHHFVCVCVCECVLHTTQWRTHRKCQGVQSPPTKTSAFFECYVCIKIVYLLLYSFYPKFCTGKRKKYYSNITFFFIFWGQRHPDPLPGLCPRTPLGVEGQNHRWTVFPVSSSIHVECSTSFCPFFHIIVPVQKSTQDRTIRAFMPAILLNLSLRHCDTIFLFRDLEVFGFMSR